MAGHTNGGIVGMFCGSNLSDMKPAHPALFNFCVGHAEYAFNGIKYPEGVKARGGLWPFGLYICPKINRFFAFFHNESGWKGCGTAYDSYGPCETPRIDSDFRHIGLIHSDDEGKHWTFDRWVLTAESVCFTDKYNPDGINVLVQKSGKVCLGGGDFSLYIPQKSDYIYLFYSMITIDTESKKWLSCDVSFNAEGDPYVIKGNKFTVVTDDKAQDTGDVYCNDFTLE